MTMIRSDIDFDFIINYNLDYGKTLKQVRDEKDRLLRLMKESSEREKKAKNKWSCKIDM